MDARTLLQQIGNSNLMAVGARDFVKSEAKSMLMFRVGSGRKLAKIIVTLTPNDTYDVQYVEIAKRSLEVLVSETAEDIYCDNIGEVVRRLGDRP